jgi:dephospho-CoA kinase
MGGHQLPGLRLGLSGGIGSGKSTVARRFGQLGALVIDVDALGRALTAPGGDAIAAIGAAFGPGMIAADGAMDRAKMRALVIEAPGERLRLEAILHPLIGAATRARASCAAAGQAVVFDVPLLAESGTWRTRVDRVVIVDCSTPTQVARVVQRSGWTADAVERMIAVQASRSQRRAIADAVIVNETSTLAQLEADVDALWAAWTGGKGLFL